MSGATDSELASLGLTADEARAYMALLQRGRLPASALASAAGISRGRIYEVTKGLVSKGVALEALSSPRTFEALLPGTAVANLLDQERERLARLEERAGQLVSDLVHRVGEAPGSPDFIEVLRHPASVQELIARLKKEASEEVLMFIRPPFFAQTYTDDDAELRALERGVSLRCLYESALLEDEGRVRSIQEFVDAGGQAKHTDSIPLKVAVFDRWTTVIPMQEPVDPDNLRVLVVRHGALSELAALAFEHLWSGASPIPSPGLGATGTE